MTESQYGSPYAMVGPTLVDRDYSAIPIIPAPNAPVTFVMASGSAYPIGARSIANAGRTNDIATKRATLAAGMARV
jgi:hypothetical protein